MATAGQIADVRRMAQEALTAAHTDEVLSALIDARLSVSAAAAELWQEAAGRFVKLVSTSESGSSRSNQQIHQNMLNMAKHYSSMDVVTPEEAAAEGPFTMNIERV